MQVYKTQPISWIECGDERKIPVFSSGDDYTENYDKISEDHLAHFDRTGENPFISEDLWHESEINTLSLIKKHVKENSFILDVGCGTGRLLGMLPAVKRHGLDISASYLKRASQAGIDVCLGKVEDMPYRDGVFDIVVCTDVLEHVLNLNYALEQVLRVLKEDGVLIIRVPYKEDLSIYLSPDFPYSLAHLRAFDEITLRLILEKIFRGKILEERLGPYLVGSQYLKCPNNSVWQGKLLRGFFRLVRFFSKRIADRLTEVIFNPVEINVVFKKNGWEGSC